MYSLKIENGRVFNFSKNAFIRASVGLNEGIIETIESPTGSFNASIKDAQIKIDASNLLVAPGFIDFHGHFFEKSTEIGVNPDLAALPFGITAVVDAGSTGISNFVSFSDQVLKRAHVTMKCFLNIAPAGLVTTQFHEDVNPDLIDEDKIAAVYQNNKDVILGLKLRFSKEVVIDHGMEPLKKARAIADKLGCRLNVHVTNPAGSVADMLKYFKSGDIFTHVFHGKGETIIKKGKVLPKIIEARERSVLFDAANGANHFSFDVAQDSIKCGFFPDIISTDITKNTLMKPPVFSLIHILSQYLNMGARLEELIPACTQNAAKIMGLDDQIGDIAPGKNADITIFNVIGQIGHFTDFIKKTLVGKKYIEPVMTIKNGVILYLNPQYVSIVARG